MNMMCLFCIGLEIHPYEEKGSSNFGISWLYVWESFQDATSQPYGYLMLDLHPRTPAILRLRSNILPVSQSLPVVYVNKKTHKTDGPLTVDVS